MIHTVLGAETIIDRLRTNADRYPNKTAFTFLAGDLTELVQLTYSLLQAEVMRIGAELIDAGKIGQRALLIYPPGLDFICGFLGCLYAGVVPVPIYPPRNNRSVGRVLSIAENCHATIALTSSQLYTQIERWCLEFPMLATLDWRVTDAASAHTGTDTASAYAIFELSAKVDTRSTAFLQYTSGSTGLPKGVMVSHENIMHNQRAIQAAFHHSENDVILGWLPVYHDMGLIGNVLQSLFLGASCVLLAPTSFLQHPIRWLEAISKYRANTSGGPNFAFDLCVRKIDDAQLGDIDLSSWTVAFCGAEPIRSSTLARFAQKFAPCGFRGKALYPCYGLAEGTLIVSGSCYSEGVRTLGVSRQALKTGLIDDPVNESDSLVVVCCGSDVIGTSIAIVDPRTLERSPANRIGEIWVSGPNIAQGYWENDLETCQAFHIGINGGAAKYLRTGDLGFLREGELYVTGRLKDILIVAGHNYYPQDIEAAAETSHPAFQNGACIAFAAERDEYTEVVVVQEVIRHHERYDLAAACLALRSSVSEQCGVGLTTVVLVEPGILPKTSSGKIQRSACRQSYLDVTLNHLYAWTLSDGLDESETGVLASYLGQKNAGAILSKIIDELMHLIAVVLRVDAGLVESQISASSLGLDSLNAVELQHAVETRFGVSLPIERYLGQTSLESLAAAIAESASQNREAIERTELSTRDFCNRSLPLTQGQSALWMLQQICPGSTAYYLNGAAYVEGVNISERLPVAVAMVIDRHPALRMTFTWRGGMLTQTVAKRRAEAIEVIDASEWTKEEAVEVLQSASAEPLDLRNGPVCRTKIFVQSPNRCILHFSVHHIVADYWSIIRVLQDLATAAHRTLIPTDIGFLKLLVETMTRTEDPVTAEYWIKQLASPLPVSNLPSILPRPSTPSYRGRAVSLDFTIEQTEEITGFVSHSNCTLFGVLLTAYFLFLVKVSGQHEHIVGVPVSGRKSAAFAESVGYFVNTLPIRVAIPKGCIAASLIRTVQERLHQALKHQQMPFSEMVRSIALKPDASRNPVFQTMFTYLGAVPGSDAKSAAIAFGRPEPVTIERLTLTPIPLETTGAQCDFAIDACLVAGRLALSARYSLDLFCSARANGFLTIYRDVLLTLVRNPSIV